MCLRIATSKLFIAFYLKWDLDPSANAEVKDRPFSWEGKTHWSYAFTMLESWMLSIFIKQEHDEQQEQGTASGHEPQDLAGAASRDFGALMRFQCPLG